MVAPKIIYFTNAENTTFNRSHNWELHRELYYKIGYTYSLIGKLIIKIPLST